MKTEGKVLYVVGKPVKTSVKLHARMKSTAWIIISIFMGLVLVHQPVKATASPTDVGHAPLPAIVAVAELPQPVFEHVETVERMMAPVSSGLANLYAWGNCTAYVASKLPVPSDWGNAITWGTTASAQGYEVSDAPRVGAIAWSVTDSYLGHVALVEAVNGSEVTISEMNYQGLGVVDTRLANPGEFRYIYL